MNGRDERENRASRTHFHSASMNACDQGFSKCVKQFTWTERTFGKKSNRPNTISEDYSSSSSSSSPSSATWMKKLVSQSSQTNCSSSPASNFPAHIGQKEISVFMLS